MLRLSRSVARLTRVTRSEQCFKGPAAVRCLHASRVAREAKPPPTNGGNSSTNSGAPASSSNSRNAGTQVQEANNFHSLLSLARSDMERPEAVRLVAAMMLHAQDQPTREAIPGVVEKHFSRWDAAELYAEVDAVLAGDVEEGAFEKFYSSADTAATSSSATAPSTPTDPLALNEKDPEAVQAELNESLALEGKDVELLDEFLEQMQTQDFQDAIREWSDKEKWEYSHIMSLLVNVNGGANILVLRRALEFLKQRDVEVELSQKVPEAINQRPIPDVPPMGGVNPLELAHRRANVNLDSMHIAEPKKAAKGDPYPNLMTPDPLMDSRDEVEFPPNKDSPFHNRVVVRNHYSMFHEAMERSGFNWKKPPGDWQPTRSDLLEDDVTPAEAANLPPSFNPSKLMVYRLMERFTTQQTPKGKINHMQVFTVVGDGNGLLGLGVAKDKESGAASSKALVRALRNLDYVDRFESRTVWTDMETKFGACKVILRPRPVGFGLRCSPILHQILKAAGIKDVSAKIWGSRNPVMVMQAATRMLQGGHAPLGMGDGVGGKGRKRHKGTGMRSMGIVERERGRKLIPLRK